MGAGSSLESSSVLAGFQQWQWTRAMAVVKAYSDEEYDFGIDARTIATITGLTIEEGKSIVKILAKDKKSTIVNALTLLIVILALADSSQQMIETRLSAIFDLFDFAGTSQISRDEATILLMCIASALASIFRKQDTLPPDSTFVSLTNELYDDRDTRSGRTLQRFEFISWGSHILFDIPPPLNLETIYRVIFLKVPINAPTDESNSQGSNPPPNRSHSMESKSEPTQKKPISQPAPAKKLSSSVVDDEPIISEKQLPKASDAKEPAVVDAPLSLGDDAYEESFEADDGSVTGGAGISNEATPAREESPRGNATNSSPRSSPPDPLTGQNPSSKAPSPRVSPRLAPLENKGSSSRKSSPRISPRDQLKADSGLLESKPLSSRTRDASSARVSPRDQLAEGGISRTASEIEGKESDNVTNQNNEGSGLGIAVE